MSDKQEKNLEARIMDLIVKGLESGERLPTEKQLASDFGVSRASLREVMSAYEANGTIVALQGSGRYVQMPDVSDSITDGWTILLRAQPALLLELLDIRSVLEFGFLQKAIERLEIKDIQLMNDVVERMTKNAEQGEVFVNEDQEFHSILFSRTGNILLLQLLKVFWYLYEQTNVLQQQQDGLMEAALLHRRVLEAIIKKDTEQALELMKEQFKDVRFRLTMSLSKSHLKGGEIQIKKRKRTSGLRSDTNS